MEPEKPRAGWGDGPGATQLVDDAAGELGVRTRGLRLLFTHQLLPWPYLSLAPRKLPKRALEVGTKTNFATVCPAGLPPAPSHLLALLSARRCKPRVARSRPSASDCAALGLSHSAVLPAAVGERSAWARPRPLEDTPWARPLPCGNVVGSGPDPAPPTRPPEEVPASPAPVRGWVAPLVPPSPQSSLIHPASPTPGPASSPCLLRSVLRAPPAARPCAAEAWLPAGSGPRSSPAGGEAPLTALPNGPAPSGPSSSVPASPQALPPPRQDHVLLPAYPSPLGQTPAPSSPFPALVPP